MAVQCPKLTFKLWDAAIGGNLAYTEISTDVPVTGGIYSYLLGSAQTLTAAFDKPYWLGVTVGNSQNELSPRAQLSSAPYTLSILGQSNVFPSNGSVGIGTTAVNSDAKLQVEGNIRVNGRTGLNTFFPDIALNVQGMDGDTYHFNVEKPDGTDIFSIRPDGRAGLNTVYNNTALNVRGVAGDVHHFNVQKPDGTDIFSIRSDGRAGLNTVYTNVALNVRGVDGDGFHFNIEKPDGTNIFSIRSDGRAGFNGVYNNVALNVRGVAGDGQFLNVDDPSGTAYYQVQANGNSYTKGNVTASGVKSFVIDHPLDPANKVLTHICIESPDAYNLYQDMVTLDADGKAWVQLPDYYEALNKDSRYQLTCVGGWAQVYIAEEVHNNRFLIAGGNPGMKVSWQVTGTRNDPWMRENRPAIERAKNAEEEGSYFYPKGCNQPPEMSYGRNKKQEDQILKIKDK